MKESEFIKFKKNYLKRFIKYYNECSNAKQRNELKKNITDNNNLTNTQKKEFWDKVLKNELES